MISSISKTEASKLSMQIYYTNKSVFRTVNNKLELEESPSTIILNIKLSLK